MRSKSVIKASMRICQVGKLGSSRPATRHVSSLACLAEKTIGSTPAWTLENATSTSCATRGVRSALDRYSVRVAAWPRAGDVNDRLAMAAEVWICAEIKIEAAGVLFRARGGGV